MFVTIILCVAAFVMVAVLLISATMINNNIENEADRYHPDFMDF